MSLTKVSYSMISGTSVDVRDFGAVCDGTTDDTAAVQAAIDYCLSFTTPLVNSQSLIPVLAITGMCNITSSLKIDRPINQTGFFRIVGTGTVGGFLTTTTGITIFSTNYSGSNKSDPNLSQLTNQVSFENLTFSMSGALSPASYAIDLTKYVRTQVLGCFFQNMPCNPNPGNSYIQSCLIENCFFRGTVGKAIDTSDMYDVRVQNCLFEVVSDICIYAGGSVDAGVFSNNLSQNCGNLFFNCANALGVELNGNYIEANVDRFVKIDNAYGVTISNNFVQTRASSPNNAADATFFEVYLGDCDGATIQSNYFTNRGVQIEGTPKIALVDNTNYAGTTLLKSGQVLTRTISGYHNFERVGSNVSPEASFHAVSSNGSGIGPEVRLNNSAAGYGTETAFTSYHQGSLKGTIKTTLNSDTYGSANYEIYVLDTANNFTRVGKINKNGIQLNLGVVWYVGSGSPEGNTTAVVGSLYSRTDGGAGTSLYVKESGTGNTGWVAK